MNERIKELAKQAELPLLDIDGNCKYGDTYFSKEKFAELIVKECIYTLQRKVVRNGNTPENQRSREHIRDLGEKFGITFPMDYYPNKD